MTEKMMMMTPTFVMMIPKYQNSEIPKFLHAFTKPFHHHHKQQNHNDSKDDDDDTNICDDDNNDDVLSNVIDGLLRSIRSMANTNMIQMIM